MKSFPSKLPKYIHSEILKCFRSFRPSLRFQISACPPWAHYCLAEHFHTYMETVKYGNSIVNDTIVSHYVRSHGRSLS